jgi:cell division transport system permease protein
MEKRVPDLVRNLPYNPLPDAFEIVPRDGSLADDIRRNLSPPPPGVDNVKDGGETAKRILHVGQIVWIVFIVAVAVLLIASTLLIANTIRLAIFARRREIEVMKLVGATNWFVRGPFMVEGLICGLVGSIAAIVLLLLGKEVALPAILGRIDSSSDAQALSFELNALILLGVGLLLGAAGSGLTLRRFLRV